MALSMGYGLVQEQRMKLVMTPELRQAIQILQFSTMDLIQYIQEQTMENPVLEMDDNTPESMVNGLESTSPEKLADWNAYVKKNSGYPFSEKWDEENGHPVDRVSDSGESLIEVLEEQIRYLTLDVSTKKVCQFIIGNLDEDGYLRVDDANLCKRFNLSRDHFEEALQVVQSLDPAGVGARDLSECLLIQLQRKGDSDPLTLQIVQSHLSDLAEGKYKKVAKSLECTVLHVQKAVDRIRNLNPRPGLLCQGSRPHYIFPDVTIKKTDGRYEVLVNESYLPRLGISSHYEQILRNKDDKAQQAVSYVKDRIQSAVWLMKSIEQRKNTLYRVTEAIVEAQRDFLEYGASQLKPLTLKEIADPLDLHESTVSRATKNKYIQTPRGLYPFRFFFSTGISNQKGGNMSVRIVKDKMVQIIESEEKTKPLSDQKIADRLKQDGIRVSRRTVAKYREEMGIAASKVRQRFDE
ncbi:RNA polymerase factor sigma-54 [Melghirimyces algeriensis]|uniref:RNA polymerase, sigma 54 subunit, RpoN/SigL n=1 Tax=Melghirimyces algeriensis TaxID=910412 RepID=A0A521D2S3_9BACL|nr:RNA polymerase factor sigma-54 [Melghirimyces algeriensis]SMO65210.1 RNA polymerase, sigma 54 subunit, RpoN/SigL [Melghirimyces algeriensis]